VSSIRKPARTLTGIAVFLFFVIAAGRAADHEAKAHYQPGQHNTRHAICQAFGAECAKAIRVAQCESNLNPFARSRDGRYWGLYQFGAYARATYGFAWNHWAQARAAARMRKAEGWGPWPVCGRR
jgi:hypothetical protein